MLARGRGLPARSSTLERYGGLLPCRFSLRTHLSPPRDSYFGCALELSFPQTQEVLPAVEAAEAMRTSLMESWIAAMTFGVLAIGSPRKRIAPCCQGERE